MLPDHVTFYPLSVPYLQHRVITLAQNVVGVLSIGT